MFTHILDKTINNDRSKYMSYYDHSQSPVEFAYNDNGKNMRAINWN
ncbi:ribonucleoside-diphosphate reductase, partial [Lactobacillus crispatus]